MQDRTQLQIITGKGKKGRSFRADLLAWVDAPSMFQGGGVGNNHRPVWIAIATSEQETGAFVTNFRRGERAEKVTKHGRTDRWQLLKAAGYQHYSRKMGDGVVTTCYLPELFDINPGMVDPDGIQFIMLVSQQWLDRQTIPEAEAEALLFLAYLDRRTRFPFPPDAKFARGLLDRCLEMNCATRGQSHYGGFHRVGFRYREYSFGNLGMRGGIAFQMDHERFGELLADEIQKWR